MVMFPTPAPGPSRDAARPEPVTLMDIVPLIADDLDELWPPLSGQALNGYVYCNFGPGCSASTTSAAAAE
jgi:hypothetical protein